MTNTNNFDVIIIGGSYAGLSAGMALGRSLRRVLLLDSGAPCNRQTPHSHNFITHDGAQPGAIAAAAKAQVLLYPTVSFLADPALSGRQVDAGFVITTQSGASFNARKLIFASGIKDIFPALPGFAECWGISVIHCPYCHGYEVRGQVTGILADGDAAMHYAQLITNLTNQLTIFTNGPSSLTAAQREKANQHHIAIVETTITRLGHKNGQIENIVFDDGTSLPVNALYARVPFVQHTDIPEKLGCQLSDLGVIVVDALQKTTVPGVYACGDSTSLMRSVANAVGTGNIAGAAVNNELCSETFYASGNTEDETNLPADMEEFWDASFIAHQAMWGFEPTYSALLAKDLFAEKSIQDILIPGIGYGRNARVFLENGMKVTGIEISPTAVEMARSHYGAALKIFLGSVTDMPFDDHLYEGIFCYGLVYLLAPGQREKMIRDSYNQLKPGGWMIFSVVSRNSPNYGKGREVRKDTFEVGKGGQVFFYDEDTVKQEFGQYGLTDAFEIEEPHKTATDKPAFRFIFIICRKES